MTGDPKTVVAKLWAFCDELRDDGLSYGDYLEQLTYLLFLKMADEHELQGSERVIPVEYDWQSLLRAGRAPSLKPTTAMSCQSWVPATACSARSSAKRETGSRPRPRLRKLIKEFVDEHEWLSYDADVKGVAYEGLVEKTAREGARGAGQYFTPRSLISAIVDVMLPRARPPHMRPGLRHRRVLSQDLQLNHRALDAPRARPGGAPAIRSLHGLGNRGPSGPAVCHEPAATRHREPPSPTRPSVWTTLCAPIPASASTWC